MTIPEYYTTGATLHPGNILIAEIKYMDAAGVADISNWTFSRPQSQIVELDVVTAANLAFVTIQLDGEMTASDLSESYLYFIDNRIDLDRIVVQERIQILQVPEKIPCVPLLLFIIVVLVFFVYLPFVIPLALFLAIVVFGCCFDWCFVLFSIVISVLIYLIGPLPFLLYPLFVLIWPHHC